MLLLGGGGVHCTMKEGVPRGCACPQCTQPAVSRVRAALWLAHLYEHCLWTCTQETAIPDEEQGADCHCELSVHDWVE